MIKRIPALCLFLLSSLLLHSQDSPLRSGMKINKTIRIKKAVYALDAPMDTSRKVIVIEGNNIVVDFNSAVLKGSNKKSGPDEFFGIAILIVNSNNVTIKNLVAKGYKIALLARNSTNLVIENCDLSYNYRPRLNSSRLKEDMSDWMSYHNNDKDEWLRYGAAIYLSDCVGTTVRNCRVTGGQNALMMNRCNNGKIYNNDFSFNSGIGIGLYRSGYNEVVNNRVIFNVRGYSHGFYNRGQDSAGMLVYEQSHFNLFAGNNVTHGGDGFFLWAGQSTMETGVGGCNDNVIVNNDFSYAPTNGIEVTFSRNSILNNRMYDCDHGIWGGYSYETTIAGNRFRNNRIGIAIEHGQNNKIHQNIFNNDQTAIRLWSREKQPADWGYARHRDTRSRGYAIVGNSFNNNKLVYDLRGTDSLNIFYNTYSNSVGGIFKHDSTVSNMDTTYNLAWDNYFSESDSDNRLMSVVKDAIDPYEGSGALAGRKNIRMMEWGPYDYRSPLIWHTNPGDTGKMEFEILGPAGNWVLKSQKGLKNISVKKGKVPGLISAERTGGKSVDIMLSLEYRGEVVVSPKGVKTARGMPYSFSFREFFQPVDWNVLFFSLDTSRYNPIREEGLFSPLERKAPVKEEKVKELDYAWWGGLKAGENVYSQFLTIAEAELDMTPGKYELSVTWDDAVRIYLDGRLVLNEWEPARHKFDESPNRKIPLIIKGKHSIRVEHIELGGFATLNLKWKKLL